MTRLRGNGTGPVDRARWSYVLLRREILMEAQVDQILEHGCARRQIRRIQQERVKRVMAGRRAVDCVTAFEYAGVVLGVVHAHQGSVVIEMLAAPVLEITEEVVHASVGAKIITCPPSGLRERNVLAR